jgi:hypothetical protein
LLPGANQHFFRDGRIASYMTGTQVFGTVTIIRLEGEKGQISAESV